MSRFLVTSMPFAGHVGPTAGLAAELIARGHEVVAYTGGKYVSRFAELGAQVRPWVQAQDYDDADLAATFPAVGNGKGMRSGRANVELVLLGTAAGQAADIRATVEEHSAAGRPIDAIAADQLALGSALAAEALGLPWATVAITALTLTSRHLPPVGLRLLPVTGPVGRFRDAALRSLIGGVSRKMLAPQVNRVRGEVGLPQRADASLDDGYSPHLVLAQGVPGLDYPRPDLPAHVHYVGRLAPAARADAQLPEWWPELAAARAQGRPVVHVTQGTLDVDPDDLLRPTIAALAGGEALVVATTGGAPESALDPLPGNVRVARFVPHDLLLPLVDVVVTNGGWGGALAAVQAGVPLVVAGATLDKPEVGRRVAWSGVGLDLRTGSPAAGRVGRAVAQVLKDPGFRRRAAELGAALTAAGGAPAAAKLIEQLLTAPPRESPPPT
ncbi:glycosyltransferase [Dactylosporangium sp. NPDC049525]|uniref:glycosyltransferase n=1 Tax=Dactylosporangium sp. NPDC049525 TaxID=3154730 RepID=UPI0034159FEE